MRIVKTILGSLVRLISFIAMQLVWIIHFYLFHYYISVEDDLIGLAIGFAILIVEYLLLFMIYRKDEGSRTAGFKSLHLWVEIVMYAVMILVSFFSHWGETMLTLLSVVFQLNGIIACLVFSVIKMLARRSKPKLQASNHGA